MHTLQMVHTLPSVKGPVRGVVLQTLPRFEDRRGALAVAEIRQHIPFAVERLFLVYDVPGSDVRGEHAHRELHQFLICARGSCTVLVDDGEHRQEYLLDSPARGLYIPPMIWSVQHRHSADALMLVLASAAYDPEDYLHDYKTFQQLVRTSHTGSTH
jgi:UDP-2-acetamido-3-amino-2,3-dideoxy-glucuronate N-acetyltransferase